VLACSWGLRSGSAALAGCVAWVLACATPTERGAARAEALGLERRIVQTPEFPHVVFDRPGGGLGASPRLHVYLEGDASPRRAVRWRPPDPTPERTVALELLALDPAPGALYLGRPCQHGAGGCRPADWTLGRYSERVVASLAHAVAALAQERRAEEVVLIGFSGGGTLAMLVAERVPEVRAVVTVAGNLDVAAWVAHHGFTPLTESLDPAQRPPLPPSIVQLHLMSRGDARVPPELGEAMLARQPGAQRRVFDDFDHDCCWGRVWPEALRDLDEELAHGSR
jgi:pimeloyl-ACP methyl ester carboxylesterase